MRGGFVWDDVNYIDKIPQTPTCEIVQADDGLYRIWTTTETFDYWPLTHTMFWLEWRLWGMNPAGYHVVNILLHALAAVLVWQVLKRLKVPGAWLAGLIFAVHPICAESAAWISERKNTLSIVFYLLAILAYLNHERLRSWRWYAASLVAFALALLSKTSVVMLPVVLLGCAWWQRRRITAGDFLRSIPFFALAGVMALVTVLFQKYRAIVGWDIAPPESFLARLAGAAWAVWFYLYKALLPLKLSAIYPKWRVDAGAIASWLPMIALTGSLAVTWRYRRTWGRPVLFAMGYFVVTLFPVMGFFDMAFMEHSMVADHFQYVPIVGIIALAAGLLGWLWNSKRRAVRKVVCPAAGALVVVLAVLTWQRAGAYKSQEMLWRDTLAKNPNSPTAHNNLGVVYKRKGQLDKAEEYYRKALEIEPNPKRHYNLANMYAESDRLDEAEEQYRKALKIRPNYGRAHYNLGALLFNRGDLDRAVEHFRRVLEIQPDFAPTHYNLGEIYQQRGQLDKAVESYSTAVRIDPDYLDPRRKLAQLYAQKGNLPKAAEHYRKVIQINPWDAMAHAGLGAAYVVIKELDKALYHCQVAIRIKPGFADAHSNLGLIYVHKGQVDKAIRHYLRAIEIEPNHRNAHHNLGIALERQYRLKEALNAYRRALEIDPRNLTALIGMAWLLATAPQDELRSGRQAVQLSERAYRILGRMAPARLLDTLAAAYAEAGRFAEAIATAQQALERLDESQQELIQEIAKRLALYKASKPYHQPLKGQ